MLVFVSFFSYYYFSFPSLLFFFHLLRFVIVANPDYSFGCRFIVLCVIGMNYIMSTARHHIPIKVRSKSDLALFIWLKFLVIYRPDLSSFTVIYRSHRSLFIWFRFIVLSALKRMCFVLVHILGKFGTKRNTGMMIMIMMAIKM